MAHKPKITRIRLLITISIWELKPIKTYQYRAKGMVINTINRRFLCFNLQTIH